MANPEQVAMLRRSVEEWNQWRKENPDVEIDLSEADLSLADFSLTNFSHANLRNADLSHANLRNADFTGSVLSKADLSHVKLRNAKLLGTILSSANLNFASLFNANLNFVNLSNASLNFANLSNTDLFKSILKKANLSNANLNYANLSNVNLLKANLRYTNFTQCKVVEANFQNAILTGACIKDWHINNGTNFENVICDYIYLKYDWDTKEFTERRPSDKSKTFNQGDFQRLIETTRETIDLIFSQGIDWNAFLTSFNNLQIEDDYQNLSVKAIEQKDDGTFVVRVNAPDNIDKGEIEREFFQRYENKLTEQKEQYQQLLNLKDEQIMAERRHNASLENIIYTLANRPISIQNINQPHSGSGDNIVGNTTVNDNA